MIKIKLTKIQLGDDNRLPPSSAGISTVGSSWEGEVSPMTPKPIVGKPFFISNYKTSVVQEIISDNTFKTLNSTYQWEVIK